MWHAFAAVLLKWIISYLQAAECKNILGKLACCHSWQSFEEVAAFHSMQEDILARLTGMKHRFMMEDLPQAVRIDPRYKIFAIMLYLGCRLLFLLHMLGMEVSFTFLKSQYDIDRNFRGEEAFQLESQIMTGSYYLQASQKNIFRKAAIPWTSEHHYF